MRDMDVLAVSPGCTTFVINYIMIPVFTIMAVGTNCGTRPDLSASDIRELPSLRK